MFIFQFYIAMPGENGRKRRNSEEGEGEKSAPHSKLRRRVTTGKVKQSEADSHEQKQETNEDNHLPPMFASTSGGNISDRFAEFNDPIDGRLPRLNVGDGSAAITVTASRSSSDGLPPLRIALASDFFCPNAGGIETHIYYLAHCLLHFGHHVIVVTHAYGDRRGVRYLSNGLKVYYLPFLELYNGCSMATIVASAPWFREIFIRERIQLVHGHSTFSTLGYEAMLHGWTLGLRTCFTDHSLFGFADASAILMNQLVLRYNLVNVDRVICVSHTSKENTVLRASLPPEKVSVIPNAIDCDRFLPDPEKFRRNTTTVVCLSRLVYRKGSDMLAEIVPALCSKHPELRFIIGGDGPKRVLIEEMREKHRLHDRVLLPGMVPHSQVRDLLVEGQIFLNTSLTEAFCMSIVEAASCGLHVVSTRVGGIPEVLPEDMITLTEPDPGLLIAAVDEAIMARKFGRLMCPEEKHRRVREMYYWPDVARRTEIVYRSAISEPSITWAERLRRYYRAGGMFCTWYMDASLVNMLLHKGLAWLRPEKALQLLGPPGQRCEQN